MRWRQVIALPVLAGFSFTILGCGVVAGPGSEPEPAEYQAESVDTFDWSGLTANAGDLSYAPTSVALPIDPAGGTSESVAVVLASTSVSVHPRGAPSGKRNQNRSHHAEVTFLFSGEGVDACESEDRVGPFAIIFEDGEVTLLSASHEAGPNVRQLVRSGRFTMCAEVWADFDGSIVIEEVSFEFRQRSAGDGRVEICHGPRGNGGARHTITVAGAAVDAHLAHGDQLGACEDNAGDDDHGDDDDDDDCEDACGDDDDCEDSCGDNDDCEDACGDDDNVPPSDADGDGVVDELDACPGTPPEEPVDADGCSCSQRDADADGVTDCDDLCPDTSPGDIVELDGCTVIVLAANAGNDVSVFEGDQVLRVGDGLILAGTYDPASLVYVWEQVQGSPADYQSDSPPLSVQTDGVEGVITFRLTVSTQDGASWASDEFSITVNPVWIVGISAGRWHNAAWRNDSSLSLWGWNRYGQLGDGSLSDGVTSVSAAAYHTLLTAADGTAWTFGRNALVDSSVPVQIPGVSQVVQVATLANGGLMLDANGAVWGFTDDQNTGCALADTAGPGDGTALGPLLVPGLPETVTAISAGSYHSLALDADGNAWVWGGRFGCTPWVALDNVVAVSAGTTNLCLFLRGDGTAWGLGFNLHGQLGNGTTITSYSNPTQVIGLSGVSALAAGDRHSLFLLDDGTLWASGWNHDCQLGLESEVSPAQPVFGDAVREPVQVNVLDVVAISAGYAHSVAITADDTVWAWGSNGVGQFTGGTATTLPATVCMPMPIDLGE